MVDWETKAVNRKICEICHRSVEEILENYLWNLQGTAFDRIWEHLTDLRKAIAQLFLKFSTV